MIEINLVPDVKQELLRAQSMRAAVISGAILTSIIAGAVVVLLALYVYGVQTVRSGLVSDEIKTQYKTLSEVKDLSKVLTIQNQLAKMSELNDNKKIDSRIFSVVSAVVPPAPNEVQISQIDINSADGIISFEGQTRAYDSMEVFKKTLDSAIVVYQEDGQEQTVKLAATLDTSEVSYGENANGEKVLMFTISFEYPEELFSPAIKEVTIKLSVDGNVTDSYLGIPRSIFAERAKEVE
ncbi:MAG: hypothetical protein ACREGE_04020 [Candidatus Microsaccharimonas sp.]